MTHDNKRVTVVTPSWNRRKGLETLYKSLCKQTSKAFVWLVADDGSTDGSQDFLIQIIRNAEFPVRVILSSLRVGKAVLDNLMIDSITTEYYLNCDSDDWLTTTAIEDLLGAFDLYGHGYRSTLDFVYSYNKDLLGKPQTVIKCAPPSYLKFADLNTFFSGDATMLLRTSKFNQIRHKEVDFVVTEASAYVGKCDDLFGTVLPRIVKVMNRSEMNSISFSKGMKYCRGSAFALRQLLDERLAPGSRDHYKRIKLGELALLARYTINGDLGFRFFWTSTKDYQKTTLTRVSAWLLGGIFSVRDKLFGDLEKTHIQFERNLRESVIFEVFSVSNSTRNNINFLN